MIWQGIDKAVHGGRREGVMFLTSDGIPHGSRDKLQAVEQKIESKAVKR